jgi:hypothetical protein
MSGLVHDLRLALRTLASRWRFFLLVIATMAIGIGTTVGSGRIWPTSRDRRWMLPIPAASCG